MLSMKAKYAIRALGILAKSEENTFSIRELSEKSGAPQKFLESILLEIKRHKIIDSKRGIGGGYFLTLPAAKIKIGDIIRYIDGPLALVRCASVTNYKKCDDCPSTEKKCKMRKMMLDARNAVASVLDKRTLKDMIN